MFGIQVSRANHEALVHFWRVIGHMIGIRDEYNLFTDAWDTTLPRLELMLTDVFRPTVSRTSNAFMQLADRMVSGLWCFNPFLNAPAWVYFTKLVNGCPGYVYYGSDPNILRRPPPLPPPPASRQCNGGGGDVGGEEIAELPYESMNWRARTVLWLVMTMFTYALNFSLVRWAMNKHLNHCRAMTRWFPILAAWMFGVRKAFVRIVDE